MYLLMGADEYAFHSNTFDEQVHQPLIVDVANLKEAKQIEMRTLIRADRILSRYCYVPTKLIFNGILILF